MKQGTKMKNEQQKGGWAMCAPGGNRRSISVFLLMTTLLFLSHIDTAQSIIKCGKTSVGSDATPTTDLTQLTVYTPQRDFCYVVYTIDGDPSFNMWNLKPYTYVAGGFDSTTNQNDFFINVCKGRTSGCELEKTTSSGIPGMGYWRLDFACCCKTKATTTGLTCNNVIANPDMDPRPVYEKMLNNTQQQICQLEYEPGARLDGCTRLTNKTESSDTPSICRSVRKKKGGDELGCAHNDADGDRCDWATMPAMPPNSGVCRRKPKGDVECCCNGAFCNGEKYMDLTCRAAITDKGDDFTYGTGQCAGATPPPTTTMSTPNGEMSSNGPVNPADTTAGEDATTATVGSNMGLIIGVSVGVVVLLLLLLAVAVGLFCWWKRRRGKVEAPEEPSALGEKNKKSKPWGNDPKALAPVEETSAITEMVGICNTGFLGLIEYGENILEGKQMRKTYDSNITKGYTFPKAKTATFLCNTYQTIWDKNVIEINDIKLHTASTPLIVISEHKHSFTPINRWWRSMLRNQEKTAIMTGNMFLINYGVAAQMAQAVMYLNFKGLTCHNIKGNNLLADGTMDGLSTLNLPDYRERQLKFIVPLVKLADYAFPDIINLYVDRDKDEALKRPSSSLEWWPPEVRTKYEFNYTTQSYMCGATMVELWRMGDKPFTEIPENERSRLYGKGDMAGDIPKLPECIPKGSYIELLITRMMDKDPEKRPWPYEAARVLRFIFINYSDKYFGYQAGFENPAEQWEEMHPNHETIHEGPMPLEEDPIPVLSFRMDKGKVDLKHDPVAKKDDDDADPKSGASAKRDKDDADPKSGASAKKDKDDADLKSGASAKKE